MRVKPVNKGLAASASIWYHRFMNAQLSNPLVTPDGAARYAANLKWSQIVAELKRERGMRLSVYPRLINDQKLSTSTAQHRIICLACCEVLAFKLEPALLESSFTAALNHHASVNPLLPWA